MLFDLKYFIKKVDTQNFSYILYVNPSRLCILAYYWLLMCISLRQFDGTILKELSPFLTWNILSKSFYAKIFLYFKLDYQA
jgi:hypothetical protein